MHISNIDFSPEWVFQTSRSGGSGGQHVNKVETKVELIFDVAGSALLTEGQKRIITERLGGRIDGSGRLHIVAQAARSQHTNRVAAARRFYELLEKALKPVKPRKKTRPSAASRRRRLEKKRLLSEKKQRRRGSI